MSILPASYIKDADKREFFQVQRSISQKGKGRVKVKEVLALYK